MRLLTSPSSAMAATTRLSERNKAEFQRRKCLGPELGIVRRSTLNQLHIGRRVRKASETVQACANIQSSWVQILSLCSKQTGTKAA